VFAATAPLVDPTDGSDIYDGRGGVDTYDASVTSASLSASLNQQVASSSETGIDTLIGIENLVGTSADDTLFGWWTANEIHGGDGKDTIQGGFGDDVLHGGGLGDNMFGSDGNDIMFGDAGFDSLNGGAGDDQMRGGFGDDVFNGQAGDDWIEAGVGQDRFFFAKNHGTDTIADYNDAADIFDVRPFNFASGAAAANTAVQVDDDVRLNLGFNTVVVLEDTLVGVIDGGDFII